jgi:4-hydroxythreonine-4-phosphate dehydrogenase
MTSPEPRIAITSGEPAGIGPEIIASVNPDNFAARLVVIGDRDLIVTRGNAINPEQKYVTYESDQDSIASNLIEVLHIPLSGKCDPGILNQANSDYVLKTLTRACKGCLDNEFDAMVTAPVHKGIINQAGIEFSGHTEFLAHLCGGARPVMLLASGTLRVALVTTHLPLRQVAESISINSIAEICEILDRDLKRNLGIEHPHIKICGLNPHAGENGYLGSEEIDIISPAIAMLKTRGIKVSGPWPADTAFTPQSLADADVILAMYHDQGLPVLKHVGFHNAINTTLGLPIVRTSVDHGTALDLAGSNKANPSSLLCAIQSAIVQSDNISNHAPAS